MICCWTDIFALFLKHEAENSKVGFTSGSVSSVVSQRNNLSLLGFVMSPPKTT